jgi:hypothetical protein
MEEYKLIVPVTGAITLNITAESIEEAVDILLKKQEALEKHPYGKLNLELDKVVAIPVESKTFN